MYLFQIKRRNPRGQFRDGKKMQTTDHNLANDIFKYRFHGLTIIYVFKGKNFCDEI